MMHASGLVLAGELGFDFRTRARRSARRQVWGWFEAGGGEAHREAWVIRRRTIVSDARLCVAILQPSACKRNFDFQIGQLHKQPVSMGRF